MSIVTVTKENFQKEVMESDKVVLLDFWAPWCGPCQMLGPVLDDLSQEVDSKVVKVDVDQSRDLAAEYGVRSVPTMFIFKDGEVVEQMIGFLTKDEIKVDFLVNKEKELEGRDALPKEALNAINKVKESVIIHKR